jgi:hypothetical protein
MRQIRHFVNVFYREAVERRPQQHVVFRPPEEWLMKKIIGSAAIALAIASMPAPADAKGCIKGALVGGVAGHYAAHHGLLGAAAGCIIGRHQAKEAARQRQNTQGHSAQGATK